MEGGECAGWVSKPHLAPKPQAGLLGEGPRAGAGETPRGSPELTPIALAPCTGELPPSTHRLPVPFLRETSQCFSRAAGHPQPAGKVPVWCEPTAYAVSRMPDRHSIPVARPPCPLICPGPPRSPTGTMGRNSEAGMEEAHLAGWGRERAGIWGIQPGVIVDAQKTDPGK